MMLPVATLALWVLSAPELPRSPCADVPAVHAVLEDAAARGSGALNVELARLESLLAYGVIRSSDPIETPEAKAALAKERVAAVCALSARAAPNAGDTTVAPAHLEAILDRPEFASARNRHADAVGSFLAWIKMKVMELFDNTGMQSFSNAARFFVLALAVALVVFMVLRLRAWRSGAKAGRSLAASVEGPLVLQDPAVHLTNARGALAGDPRRAIREGLLALLSVLERRRWARPDRVKTNRELASELPARGAPDAVATRVEELVRWYDRAFYSLEPVSPEEATRFVEEVARFEGGLPQGGAS